MHQSLASLCQTLDGVVTVGDGFKDWQHELGSKYWGHFDTCADIDLVKFSARLAPGARILVKGANKVFWVNDFVATLRQAVASRKA
jgi:hypothetical protein